MSQIALKSFRPRPKATFAPKVTLYRGVPWPISTLLLWQDRARMRHHLADLPYRLMADAGLSVDEIEAEAAKPFWRA